MKPNKKKILLFLYKYIYFAYPLAILPFLIWAGVDYSINKTQTYFIGTIFLAAVVVVSLIGATISAIRRNKEWKNHKENKNNKEVSNE